MLDYDGTLAPFVPARMKAFPYPGIGRILERILESRKNRVVIISGRNAKEVRRLLGLNRAVEIWGGHGTERLLPSGRLVRLPLPQASEKTFRRVKDWARAACLSGSLEAKHGSVAFHVRGMKKERASALIEKVTEFFEGVSMDSGLAVAAFDGGVELRTKGMDKGRVVRDLVRDMGWACACSYYGDDFTDEDAFEALYDNGVSFLVRRRFRPTRADVWIIPPDELKDCLLRYIL